MTWVPFDPTAEGAEYDDDGALLVKGAELLRVEGRAARDGSRQYKLDRRRYNGRATGGSFSMTGTAWAVNTRICWAVDALVTAKGSARTLAGARVKVGRSKKELEEKVEFNFNVKMVEREIAAAKRREAQSSARACARETAGAADNMSITTGAELAAAGLEGAAAGVAPARRTAADSVGGGGREDGAVASNLKPQTSNLKPLAGRGGGGMRRSRWRPSESTSSGS